MYPKIYVHIKCVLYYYAELCPPGLTSPKRVPPCQPVPENYYWVNASHYEACPSGENTLNEYGAAIDSAESRISCRGKQYSFPCPFLTHCTTLK